MIPDGIIPLAILPWIISRILLHGICPGGTVRCGADAPAKIRCGQQDGTVQDLCTYILNERNTVATSSQLYVGRSTLFYRLRKIKEITGLDAADMSEPVKNLYLRLSIFIMERIKK